MSRIITFLMFVSLSSALAQNQEITVEPGQQNAQPGTPLGFDVTYTTTPAQPDLTGITLRLHYDSSELTFDALTNVFAPNLLANMPVDQAETGDLDGDPATDRFVLMSWLAFNSNWPGSLPMRLYSAQFTAASSFTGSSLHFTGDTANGYGFSADDVLVDALNPGIQVQPTSGLETDESGSTDSFEVVLLSEPSAVVTLTLSSSDTSEGTVSPATLTFDATNWEVPQTPVVTGVDDSAQDGDVVYTVAIAAATSNDPSYQGLDPDDVSVVNRDDDGSTSAALIAPSGISGGPGAVVAIPISVDQVVGLGITSFEFTLNYDPALLEFTGIATAGTLSSDWTVFPNNATAGSVRVGGISTVALPSNGALVALNFTINSEAADGACSDLSLASPLFNNIPPTTTDGELCVIACVKGDANGDDLIQAYDGSLALQASVGLTTPFDPIPTFCVDADCDGSVLALDGALILRYALGLDSEFCPDTSPFNEPRDGPVSVRLAATQMIGGQSFTMPLTISPVRTTENVYSYQFTLTYNPGLLQIDGVEVRGTLSEGWVTALNTTEPGQLTLGAMSANPLAGEGVLLHLTGVALGSTGNTTLNWSQFLFGSGTPAATVEPGQVEVEQNQAPEEAVLSIICEAEGQSRTMRPEVRDRNRRDHHTYSLLGQAEHGTVHLGEDGFSYRARTRYLGEDGFRYRVRDSGGLTIEREAHVLVMGSSFFEAMGAWPSGTIMSLIEAIDQPQLTQHQARRDHQSLEQAYNQVGLAQQMIREGHLDVAVLDKMTVAEDVDGAWLAHSALVAHYRMQGDLERAFAQTAQIALDRPELSGLMGIWNGDTAALVGDHDYALTLYEGVRTDFGAQAVNGVRLGVTALKQKAQTYLALGEPGRAAQAHRKQLEQYGSEVNLEFTLGQALLYEAMAAGSMPFKSLLELAHEESSTHLVVSEGSLGRPVTLAGHDGFRFQLTARDMGILNKTYGAEAKASIRTCAVPSATDGFQAPLVAEGRGHHTGIDYEPECGAFFEAVARGCVRDTGHGGTVIEHYSLSNSRYSQYGHAGANYYSSGAAVSKGARLGQVSNASPCQLHHEIRSKAHADPSNAEYYSNRHGLK